jgi:nucleoside 2-deoxyribosyltransferase
MLSHEVIKPPEKRDPCYFRTNIFLAGSIEMGAAEEWQEKAANYLRDNFTWVHTIFNPRRDDWDSSWGENSKELEEQIKWELDYISKCDVVVFYFDPATKSPITLLELGLCLGSGKEVIVICPKGFYRRPNVVITCDRFNIPVYETLEEGLDAILES